MILCNKQDVDKSKHNKTEPPPFRSKFSVHTLKRDFVFYAVTDTERAFWLDSFNGILEKNRHALDQAIPNSLTNSARLAGHAD